MKTLLKKYFAGACTPEEAVQVEKWLSTDGGQAALSELMDETWQSEEKKELAPDQSRRILQAVQATGQQPRSQPTPVVEIAGTHKRRIPGKWLVAAGIALLLGLSALTYMLVSLGQQKTPQQTTMADPVWKTLYNHSATTKKAILPDGSQVWLTPHSQLSYPVVFAPDSRELRMEGEAYFDIAHDNHRPLTVFTGAIATRVLGTAFNIEAYPGEQEVRVILTRGKVAVYNEDHNRVSTLLHYLQPGQSLSYLREKNTCRLKQVAVHDTSVWTSDDLVLQDLPLMDALQRVARRYDVKITWEPSIAAAMKEKKVMGIFRNEQPAQIIQNMLFVHGYHYRKTNNQFIIFP